MPPLSLSDEQLAILQKRAELVPQNYRTVFLREVAAHLAPEPSTLALHAACDVAIQRAVPPDKLLNNPPEPPRKRGYHRLTKAIGV